MMSALTKLFQKLTLTPIALNNAKSTISFTQVRYKSRPNINTKPLPGFGISYRRIVHYPEEYTVQPLNVTNLAGRDPISGRVVAKGIGGGIKHKFHWIKWLRDGPAEGPPREERVIEIMTCGCRPARIALVAVGDEMKYIIATANMKAGDIIKTSRHLPRLPVRASEGDAHPIGAYPIGTRVCSIEKYAGKGAVFINAAGTFGTILRKQDGRVIVQMPSKHEFNIDERCMATVGQVSNIEHSSTPVGSPQRNRWLGNRPRSGLWKRKTGRHGRKIKKPKHITIPMQKKPGKVPIKLTLTEML